MSWVSNLPVGLAVVLGLVVVWAMLSKFQESFVPEFLDQANVKRTAETKSSSYEQRTNHVQPMTGPDVAIQGSESPFRVNAWNSYIP